jgi:hypothetical protein
MSRDQERWNELQDRWAAGEPLSVEEQRARLDYIAADPLAAREAELFRELGALGGTSDGPAEPALLERVLASVGIRTPPRLRLVTAEPEPLQQSEVRPRNRRARRVAAAVAVAVLAAGAALVMGRGRAPDSPRLARAPTTQAPAVASNPLRSTRGEVVFASGDVTVDGEPATIGRATLQVGQELKTARGHACFTIDPAIDVCLGEYSLVRLDSLAASDIRVWVASGTAIAALTKRPAGQRFSLEANDVSAAAIGTVFAVQRAAADSVRVVVVEGTVTVAAQGAKEEALFAHSQLEIERATKQRRSSSVGRGDEARLSTLLNPRRLWQESKLGVLELTHDTPGTRVMLGGEGPLAIPLRTFARAGTLDVQVLSPSGERHALQVEVLAGETRRMDLEKLHPAAASSVARSAAPSPSALLDRARQELAQGQTKAALASYRSLLKMHPGTREAHTVLVTIGKLELDSNAPAAALASFEAYLKRGGSLAPEALAGKIQALRALGRTAEERAAIKRYLARYPNGFAAPALKRRLEAEPKLVP